MTTYIYKVEQDTTPTFIDDFLTGIFPVLDTRKSIKKALKRGEIYVNNEVVNRNYQVRAGDEICVKQRPKTFPSQPPLDIVYKDEALLIVNKPPGIITSGKSKVSIEKMLTQVDPASQNDALPYPKLIHRIDRDTCGLLIAARTKSMLSLLNDLMQTHTLSKYYLAFAEGEVPLIEINQQIDSKPAHTIVLWRQVLDTKDTVSAIILKIGTGRTHQIRKHLSGIGHPLVGDDKYNTKGVSFSRGLFLQAIAVKFDHPVSGKHLSITAPLHKKFRKYLKTEAVQAVINNLD